MGLNGHGQTEIGALPTNWPLVPLSKLFEFQNGVNAEKGAYGAGIRFVNVLEVITKSHLHASDIPGRVSLPPQKASAYLVRRGDVLFNRTSETQEEVGLAAVYEGNEDVVFGGFVIRGRPLPSARLDTTYLGYALRSPHIRRQVVARGQGAIRANIGQGDLRTVLLPRPSWEEQVAIAEALDDADALIRSLERLLAKERRIKHGAIQALLTGKARLPGFSGEWDVRYLREIGGFLKGTGISKDESLSGAIPCVRYGEIYTRHDDYIKQFHSWISRGVARSAVRLEFGDIVFAGSGETKTEIGKCAAFVDAGVEAYAGGDIVILRPKNADPLFLGYYLNTAHVARQKAQKGQGDAVVHISASALGDVRVELPSLNEQRAIASVLQDIDIETASLESRLAKARKIKQGMMQELLTGRIRLVPDKGSLTSGAESGTFVEAT